LICPKCGYIECDELNEQGGCMIGGHCSDNEEERKKKKCFNPVVIPKVKRYK
jgi:hypothetical protein